MTNIANSPVWMMLLAGLSGTVLVGAVIVIALTIFKKDKK